ncbi:MAG TPA: pyridoxamine 5'-phosphate oxidase family protein [Anaerolineales bacterium]|nr:pyridoxamine 5'-phosphate oxidase family protein [Anaerolineales bacterium]
MSIPHALPSVIPGDELRDLLAVLAETSTLTLATTDPDGTPRATPVYFTATPAAALVFLSDPSTPHAKNLSDRPATAAAAYPDVEDWRDIRGVQMKGTAGRLTTDAAEDALELYRRRFGFLSQVPAALDRMSVYLFRPRWARLIDNRRGFGFVREWKLD